MVARQIAYADALKILAVGHGKLPLTVDKLLGYERSSAAAGGGQLELLRLLNVRNDLVQLGGMLLSGFGDRLRTVYGQSRANLLVAAHTVIAVNSYLLVLDDSTFLVDLSQIGFLETGQDGVAGGQGELLSRELTSMLIDTVMPPPSPHKPYEQAVLDMKARYLAMSQHLAELVKLRSSRRQYDKRRQMRFLDILLKDIPEGAAFQYDNSYRRKLSFPAGILNFWSTCGVCDSWGLVRDGICHCEWSGGDGCLLGEVGDRGLVGAVCLAQG